MTHASTVFTAHQTLLKAAVLNTLVAGDGQANTGNLALGGATGLFWDDSNKRLGRGTDFDAATAFMQLNASGNVAIGTTPPHATARLHVVRDVDKATSGDTPVSLFSSNDATYPLGIQIGFTGAAAEDDRRCWIQSVEAGYEARDLLFNPFGGNLVMGYAQVGDDGDTVFAMSAGTQPSTSPPPNTVQLTAALRDGAGTTTLFIRNEEGHVIALYTEAALTSADAGTVDSGDATTDGVIANNRARIAEIEAALQAQGLLA